jgi:hypothetical protein
LDFKDDLFNLESDLSGDQVAELVSIKSSIDGLANFIQMTQYPGLLAKLDQVIAALSTVNGSIGALSTIVASFTPQLNSLIALSTTISGLISLTNGALAGFTTANHNDFIALINVMTGFASTNHLDLFFLNNTCALQATHADALATQGILNTLATHTDVSATNTVLGSTETRVADIQSKVASLNTKLATFQINGSGQLRTTLL